MSQVQAPSPAYAAYTRQPLVIQAHSYGNGGKPAKLDDLTSFTPLFVASRPAGDALVETLACTSYDAALSEVVRQAKAGVQEVTMPEDYGYAPVVERRAPVMALLQSSDGAFAVATLSRAPAWVQGSRRPADITIEAQRRGEPQWLDEATNISMARSAPELKAIVAGNRVWDLTQQDLAVHPVVV